MWCIMAKVWQVIYRWVSVLCEIVTRSPALGTASCLQLHHPAWQDSFLQLHYPAWQSATGDSFLQLHYPAWQSATALGTAYCSYTTLHSTVQDSCLLLLSAAAWQANASPCMVDCGCSEDSCSTQHVIFKWMSVIESFLLPCRVL